jgi:DNA repair ATPase RecN
MEHIKKLYGKAYHLYTIEDWKYIFSILKEKDKYNHIEEEFLTAELIDKTAMMKMMDENCWKYGWSNTIDEQDKPLVESCSENSCETINAFLENEDVKTDEQLSSCSKVIQDFLEDGESTGFNTFRKIQQDCYEEIYQCQNRIEEYKQKILAEIQDIKAYKQKLDNAFNEYIK